MDLTAALALRAVGLARRKLAHLALCVAAIFLRTAALIVRLFRDAVRNIAGDPRIAPSSLFKRASCSLITAARLSCLTVTSYILMGKVLFKTRGESKCAEKLFRNGVALGAPVTIDSIC